MFRDLLVTVGRRLRGTSGGRSRRRSVLHGAFAVAAASAIVAGVRPPESYGCNPDFLPICGRSAFLAKFVNQVVVNPTTPAAVQVPIGLVPFVTWNPNSTICAQPTGHRLDVTVTCAQQGGGGTPVTIGPVSVPLLLSAPTTPGNQDLAAGTPFNFVIPQGTLDPSKQYRCTVVGAYTIDFGPTNKRGFGTIVGTGDTVFCTAPPAPDDANQPLIHAQLLEYGDGFHRVRGGDQKPLTYVLVNNHPTLPAIVGASFDSNTVSKSPQLGAGSTADSVYPVSTDVPNADKFATRLYEDRKPGALIPRDPLSTTGGPTGASLFIPPYGMRTISVIRGTHGMCLDGSCSEDVAEFRVIWPTGAGAIETTICLGTATQVDDSKSPRNALCSVTDFVGAVNRADARWAPTWYDNSFRFGTFGPGNHPEPQIGDHSFRTIAQNLVPLLTGVQMGEFPVTASSTVHFDVAERWLPSRLDFNMVAFRLNTAGNALLTQGMQVSLKGIPKEGGFFQVPLFARPNKDSDFKVGIDWRPSGAIYSLSERIGNRYKSVFRGTEIDLAERPDIEVTTDVYRQFDFRCPDPMTRRIEAWSPNWSADFTESGQLRSGGFGFTLHNALLRGDTGSATATSATHTQVPSSIPFGQATDFTFENASWLPIAPAPPLVEKLTFNAMHAVSSVSERIALRRVPDSAPQPDTLDIDTSALTFDFKKAFKDKLSLRFSYPIEAGYETDGKRIALDYGGYSTSFVGDSRGVFRPEPLRFKGPASAKAAPAPIERLKFAVKKKNGSVPAQDAVVTLTVTRANLQGFFADDGILDETQRKAPRRTHVRAVLDGVFRESSELLEVTSKAGKKLTARHREPN